jgi:hypothetical protein
MSKRNLPTSYSSMRRHIKAQVVADIHNIHSCVCSDENGSGSDVENYRESVYVTEEMSVTSQSHGEFHSVDTLESESDNTHDKASSSAFANVVSDFDDCHWASADS